MPDVLSRDSTMPPLLAVMAIGAACALLEGCAAPAVRADRIAQDNGYEKLLLPGSDFRHVAYYKRGTGHALHVYVEHDGTPWATPTRPANDPTPSNPLMLRLMTLDTAAVLYLGRPCYFGGSDIPPCEPIWWTHRRFSEKVIDSMAVALRSFLHAHPEFASLELFGYSGGGIVVVLLAPRFAEVERLVAVAAPFDLDGWTRLHEYSPLEGSLEPMRQPPLPHTIEQLYLAGADDDVVPANLVEPFVNRQPAAKIRVVPGFSHYCCWDRVWKDEVLLER